MKMDFFNLKNHDFCGILKRKSGNFWKIKRNFGKKKWEFFEEKMEFFWRKKIEF